MSEKPSYRELENRVRELERALAEQKAVLDHPMGAGPKTTAPREPAEPYRLMVEQANEAILVAQDGVFVFSNKRGEALFGYSAEELGSRRLTEFIHEADRKMVGERHRERLAGETASPDVYPFRIIHKSGDIRWVNLKVALFSWNGRPATLCFMTDITQTKIAEAALQESEEKYRTIFLNSPLGIFRSTPDGRFLEVNPALAEMLGYGSPDEVIDSIQSIGDQIYIRSEKRQQIVTDQLHSKNLTHHVNYYRRKDGSEFTANLYLKTVRDVEDQPVYLEGIVEDITERKQAEAALKESEEVMRYIIKHDPNAIAVYDRHLHYIAVSDRYLQDYGIAGRDILGKHHYEIFPEMPERWKAVHQRVLQGTVEKNDDDGFKRPDGSFTYNRWECRPWYRADGTIGGMITYTEVTTERKLAEIALKKSLAEKEVLLREIHHRVKNNMQTIVGLLRMYARRIDDAQLTEIFNDCRDRIGAMSLVHEALYQSDDLSRIDFEAYLKKLCRNLAHAHGAHKKRIALTINAVNVSLNMDQGVAVGMIIAELVSNAFKHAFPECEGGTVAVHLDRLNGKTVRLIVSDTGAGLPVDFDIHDPPSLGMRLVSGAVTRELGGSIKATNDGGAKVVIRFKCEEGKRKS